MTNREKIILVAMALAILYGGYNLFFASAGKTKAAGKEKSFEEISRFITDVAGKLEDPNFKKHTYVLTQAKTDWTHDPFFEVKAPVKEKDAVEVVKKETAPAETFAYSGYLQMGDRTIAIIDGLEYELGDELAKGGHIVKMIDPNRVLIGPQDENNNIVLFLNENK